MQVGAKVDAAAKTSTIIFDEAIKKQQIPVIDDRKDEVTKMKKVSMLRTSGAKMLRYSSVPEFCSVKESYVSINEVGFMLGDIMLLCPYL